MRIIITMTAAVLPIILLVRKYVGTPITAAAPKHISCLFVRLKMTLLFTFVKSFGTETYAIYKLPPIQFLIFTIFYYNPYLFG